MRFSLNLTERESVVSDGLTQASSVMPLTRSRLAASLTVTTSLMPSNDSAFPDLPAVERVAPDTVPVLPLPLESAATVPLASLKPHAPTSPEAGGSGVGVGVEHAAVLVVPVASARLDSLPAASTAVRPIV